MLWECHARVAGGHVGGKATARKILQVRLWWPTIHEDAKEYAKSCDVCQRVGNPSHWYELPLNPIHTVQIFEKWAVDFIGPIMLPAHHSHARYIITATEYLTRWAEAAPVKDCTTDTPTRFIFECIISRFGCPKSLTSAQGMHFINETVASLLNKFMAQHRKSSLYHPQANGMVETFNKILERGLTKIVSAN